MYVVESMKGLIWTSICEYEQYVLLKGLFIYDFSLFLGEGVKSQTKMYGACECKKQWHGKKERLKFRDVINE